MKIKLRNEIEGLFHDASWEGFGLYIKTGQLSGFLDGNGDVVDGTDDLVKEVLNIFQESNPTTPSDWCRVLNEKYNANLDCSIYEISLKKSSVLEKCKRLFDLKILDKK
ncbi:hypothetical protein L1281_001913 [Neisseria sp. HSC-16F19]|nr:hypothetical protein [Neisseria sp. HSC-16F19]MCP2041315.1 hypothetical protein [Neisseria sp. HSC-16F19]